MVLCIICFLAVACQQQGTGTLCILPDTLELKPGDVVFRRGNGLTSQAVLYAERDGIYSHTGIVVDSAGTLMIAHAVPDEPDFAGDVDRVKLDTPQRFFSSIKAKQGEVRRHRNQAIAQQASSIALSIYKRGVLFDHDYNDSDTTAMYCTEFVMHSYHQAGDSLSDVPHEDLHFLMLKQQCVLPSGLLASRSFHCVGKF